MKYRLFMILVFISAFSVGAEGEDTRKIDSVLRELKTLFRDGDIEKTDKKKLEPYLKIVEGAEGMKTIIYKCRCIKADTMVDALESVISPSGAVEIAEDQNLVVVHDRGEKIDELKEIILAMDIFPPQILVEAKVVEVFVDDGVERETSIDYAKFQADQNITSVYGYNLGSPSPNPLGGTGGNTGQGANLDFFPYASGDDGDTNRRFNVFLRWLKTARDVKILSSPNLIVDLGTTASIITGEEIPIQSSQLASGTVSTSIEFKRIGVKLNVTPDIINEDTVRLSVNPEVSTVTRTETFVQSGVTFNNPIISLRNIKTTLTAKNGEVIMLGGLYSSEENHSTRKPPIIGDIPILGTLFSSEYKSEELTQLVFFLKIHILEEGQTFYDPEKVVRESRGAGKILKKSGVIFPDKKEEK